MKNNLGLIWLVIFIIIGLTLSGVFAFAVSTSNLPEWFKFWLLK